MNKSDFGTVPPSLLQLPAGQLVELLPLAKFTYNNTLSATTGITPFLANKGYHLNITSTLNMTLHQHVPKFSSLTSTTAQQLWLHIAEAQCQYQAPTNSDKFPLQN